MKTPRQKPREKIRPTLEDFDLTKHEQQVAFREANWEHRNAIILYAKDLLNGGVVYCATCEEHHLVQIDDNGRNHMMARCGAWSWPKPKPRTTTVRF